MKIAVIPARGGSKRIPRKNIKDFCGKPIVAYAIEAAIQSQCFDLVIVSTDDTEIAEISKRYGALVPFVRPDALADDFTGTNDVVAHAIAKYGCDVELACCIYATAPFVNKEVIRAGMNALMESGEHDFAVTVTAFPFPIQRALKIGETGSVAMREPEHLSTRSQDLAEMYHDAGQIYWGTRDAFLQAKPLFNNRTLPLILPSYQVQDIDTEDDWLRAELMYQAWLTAERAN
ncbi:pseudaminic acid cytidylyltransferase [Moritella sp. 24]|uniref:pseudaminic acid cytidylyltransferase n=1 Tax=Moritella sp. 24 TaxID=2746230 RepID=UPI001BAE3937|nr:pseudaminic acid cytidylyltransferase [Moritella sp. 24]QUM77857.1 pseudaminic acid cytidylyltransferase [Moritella sp. 24]